MIWRCYSPRVSGGYVIEALDDFERVVVTSGKCASVQAAYDSFIECQMRTCDHFRRVLDALSVFLDSTIVECPSPIRSETLSLGLFLTNPYIGRSFNLKPMVVFNENYVSNFVIRPRSENFDVLVHEVDCSPKCIVDSISSRIMELSKCAEASIANVWNKLVSVDKPEDISDNYFREIVVDSSGESPF